MSRGLEEIRFVRSGDDHEWTAKARFTNGRVAVWTGAAIDVQLTDNRDPVDHPTRDDRKLPGPRVDLTARLKLLLTEEPRVSEAAEPLRCRHCGRTSHGMACPGMLAGAKPPKASPLWAEKPAEPEPAEVTAELEEEAEAADVEVAIETPPLSVRVKGAPTVDDAGALAVAIYRMLYTRGMEAVTTAGGVGFRSDLAGEDE